MFLLSLTWSKFLLSPQPLPVFPQCPRCLTVLLKLCGNCWCVLLLVVSVKLNIRSWIRQDFSPSSDWQGLVEQAQVWFTSTFTEQAPHCSEVLRLWGDDLVLCSSLPLGYSYLASGLFLQHVENCFVAGGTEGDVIGCAEGSGSSLLIVLVFLVLFFVLELNGQRQS